MTDKETHYCAGCTHGTIHKLIAQVIDELGCEGDTIGIAPVGCSVLAYDYFSFDMIQAPHGRAPSVATGVKRALPLQSVVFTYQGDGDLASIGLNELIHAAARNENITVIHVNNTIYGMTGGQMSATTLANQITQTSPNGRDVKTAGFPIKVCEMVATLEGASYVERVSVHNMAGIYATKRAIRKAFLNQINQKGFSLIEILSNCPTNWGITPVESLEKIEKELIPYFPLGVYREREE